MSEAIARSQMVGLVTGLSFASFNAIALLALRGSTQNHRSSEESADDSSEDEEDLLTSEPLDAHLIGIE